MTSFNPEYFKDRKVREENLKQSIETQERNEALERLIDKDYGSISIIQNLPKV